MTEKLSEVIISFLLPNLHMLINYFIGNTLRALDI